MRRLFTLSMLLVLGCGNGSAKPDAAVPPDANLAPDASCFTNPTTHEQIINACTEAQTIYKTPTLPLLKPDGTLPPLP